MNKDLVKKAFKSAEEELEKKQIDEVKLIVKKTLEKIEKLKKERRELDNKIKILKMDIDDLKEGRLDRIAERQDKDESAKKISVVVIIKEKIIEKVGPWYVPYIVHWNTPIYPTEYDNKFYCGSGSTANFNVCDTVMLTNSVVKNNTVGTYSLDSGTITNIR